VVACQEKPSKRSFVRITVGVVMPAAEGEWKEDATAALSIPRAWRDVTLHLCG
jgi:hypothetical protein